LSCEFFGSSYGKDVVVAVMKILIERERKTEKRREKGESVRQKQSGRREE